MYKRKGTNESPHTCHLTSTVLHSYFINTSTPSLSPTHFKVKITYIEMHTSQQYNFDKWICMCNLRLFTAWTIFSSKSVSFLLPPSQSPTSRGSLCSGYLMILAFTKISAMRKYAVYILLCVASFAQHKVYKIFNVSPSISFPFLFMAM